MSESTQRAIGAIHIHCMWCKSAWGREGRIKVDACEHVQCALWEFRPRLRPSDVPVQPEATP
jgi:hypothetical protein